MAIVQGGRYEVATGLCNFRHRDLSVSLGRWIEVDPLSSAARAPKVLRDFAAQLRGRKGIRKGQLVVANTSETT